jgi:hypothetical protein
VFEPATKAPLVVGNTKYVVTPFNVMAYIQTLRTSREPTFTHWWETVPSR